LSDRERHLVVPQPYDLRSHRVIAGTLIGFEVVLLARLFLLSPTPLSGLLACVFPFGLFATVGVVWLAQRDARDATWEFDALGASLWRPGGRLSVQWSEVERVSTAPSRAGRVVCLVVASSGQSRRPKSMLITTWTARSEALVVLAQQIETHVAADRIDATFVTWAQMVNQRHPAMSTANAQQPPFSSSDT